jgi:hypothetical protein
MSEDLGRQRSCGSRGPLGRRAQAQECRADAALAEVEAFPEALPGSVTEIAPCGAAGGPQAAGEDAFEEGCQGSGGEAEPSDLVSEPDAEGASAAASQLAIAAKDASSTEGFSFGAGVVEAVQGTMANQVANGVAVGTWSEFEPLDNGVPLTSVAEKQWQRNHVGPRSSGKGPWYRREVEAGYDKKMEKRGRKAWQPAQTSRSALPNSRRIRQPGMG